MLKNLSKILLLIIIYTGCTDVNVEDQEIDGLPGVQSEMITTYRIQPLPEELPEENQFEFIVQWLEAYQEVREFYSEEILEYDRIGNLVFREIHIPEEDYRYVEEFQFSNGMRIVEVETRINGVICTDCQPDRVERELDRLLQPVSEIVFSDSELLHTNIIRYNRPGEVYSIRRLLPGSEDELYNEVFSYLAVTSTINVIRNRRKFFRAVDRIRTTEYGYDDDGYLARVTEVEELPERQILEEDRFITLAGDSNRNWIIRIKNREWLEERVLIYY